jgi:hypothetical protein
MLPSYPRNFQQQCHLISPQVVNKTVVDIAGIPGEYTKTPANRKHLEGKAIHRLCQVAAQKASDIKPNEAPTSVSSTGHPSKFSLHLRQTHATHMLPPRPDEA